MKTAFLIAYFIVIGSIVIAFNGCGKRTSCEGGMCKIKNVALSETEVRKRASIYGYDKLVWRQKRPGIAITDSDGNILEIQPIDPASWDVSKSQNNWRLKRHLTRDLWQVIECNLDGSQADAFIEVDPVVNSM